LDTWNWCWRTIVNLRTYYKTKLMYSCLSSCTSTWFISLLLHSSEGDEAQELVLRKYGSTHVYALWRTGGSGSLRADVKESITLHNRRWLYTTVLLLFLFALLTVTCNSKKKKVKKEPESSQLCFIDRRTFITHLYLIFWCTEGGQFTQEF
jgi:hypothetical protein